MQALTVLFAVSEPHLMSLFADMAPLLDMKCEFVQTGREVCARLQTGVPDLVVFDLDRVSDSDLTAFERYQREARFANTRFVGLHCERREHDLGFGGANSALLKPFLHAVADLEQLLPPCGGVQPMPDYSSSAGPEPQECRFDSARQS